MKYKEFKLKIDDNPGLERAVSQHGVMLGYNFILDCKAFGFCFVDWGDVATFHNKNTFEAHSLKLMSIRDFFKLTPENVRVGSERFSCRFSFHSNVNEDHFLTQDQIDRIKEVMNEN